MPPDFQDLPTQRSALDPLLERVPAQLRQAIALHQQGLLNEAEAIYEAILDMQPKQFDALHLLGVLASQKGNHRLAADLIGKAIAVCPSNAAFYSNRGIALKELKQLDAAISSYGRAIAIKSDYADAYSNRGVALQELMQLDAAVASYDRAVAIKSDYAEAHYNRGTALQELDQQHTAVASYDRAVAIKPDYVEAHFNRGTALHQLRRLDAAVASYDRAIVIKPDFADAYWSKSVALLLDGDFDNGWELYEWRWERANAINDKHHIGQALWLGAESIREKTILLHAEQGLGDTIQFCRYANSVAALGARVILEVPAPLAGLLNKLEGVSEVIVKGMPLPAFDCHCPLLSLPLAFKTKLADIPASPAYLSSDRGKMSIWADRLGTKTKPRIGIVWSGSDAHKNDQNRSIVLSSLLPHLPDAFEYISLQKEVRDIDRTTLGKHGNVKHFGDELIDFTDTAALCELMDVVISVDTGAAHLSAALGKKTWILLPYVPDWRWLLDRNESPWYPSARLYRQDADRDWAKVFERVKTNLTALFA